VDPIPDPLLLRKSGSAGNRTQPGTLTTRPQRRRIRFFSRRLRGLCVMIQVPEMIYFEIPVQPLVKHELKDF
jgi:hypothetical protein